MADSVPLQWAVLRETPSQTAGPYVHIGSNPNWVEITGVWERDLGLKLFGDDVKGERIVIEGVVIDGGGEPLDDALIEIWQADAQGLYPSPGETRGKADPAFAGWGRQPTDKDAGSFRFETIRPGRVPFGGGAMMAPHVTVWIVARGINLGLQTRMYFPDEEAANAQDPILRKIPAARVSTLIAERAGSVDGLPVYRFDIRLQGHRETVFFDI